MNSPTSSCWDFVFSSPVSTWTLPGTAAAMFLARTLGSTPSSAATVIWSNWPCLPVTRWASGRVSTAIEAPPNESTFPSVAIPTSLYGFAWSLPAIVTRSPSSKPPFSAWA